MANVAMQSPRASQMIEMINRETIHLTPQASYTAGSAVLITGVTGSTGSYILRALLSDTKISKFYCLVRVPNGRQRLLSLFPDCKALEDEKRVVFINGDITDPHLGIPDYENVKMSISTIVHTAWLVNYNSPLKGYQPHITALRYLLNMLAGNRAAHFLFVSSMFSISGPGNRGPRVEAYISDPEAAVLGGYGESKFVAESILNHAALMQTVAITVFRCGQISAAVSTNIPWKQQEWFPILLKTSKYVGELPVDFGPVKWVPADTVGSIVKEAYHQCPSKARFLNIMNSKAVSFESLAPTIQKALGEDVRLTTRAAWVKKLAMFDRSDRGLVKAMPALKLLWFFEAYPIMDPIVHADVLKEMSPTFREIEAIRPEWMDKWVHNLHTFIQGDSQNVRARLA